MRLYRFPITACLALACLLAAGAAWAQDDPPDRVAYISALQGAAQLTLDGAAWTPAQVNMPLTTGARLSTDPGSRIELQTGSAALRLDGRSDLTVSLLDDQTTKLALTEGTLSASVRALADGERFEIDTPNMALVATTPGEYRADVDARAATTRITLRQGQADAWGAGGQSQRLAAPQQWVFDGRSLGVVAQTAAPARDDFDRWVAERDSQFSQSPSARYVPPDMPGASELDPYGQWQQDPDYGPVWFPTAVPDGWAPYRDGSWLWVEPWGWNWVDNAPWGFAPFHYGRWTRIGARWAWAPGPARHRPVYAPALVVFTDGAGRGPGAAWFPLAPGEAWKPSYNASSRYLGRLNNTLPPPGRKPDAGGGYVFQRQPSAVTVAPRDPFGTTGGSRPRFTDGSRLPPGQLENIRPAAPPPRAPTAPAATGRTTPFTPAGPGPRPPGRPAAPQAAPPAPPSVRFPAGTAAPAADTHAPAAPPAYTPPPRPPERRMDRPPPQPAPQSQAPQTRPMPQPAPQAPPMQFRQPPPPAPPMQPRPAPQQATPQHAQPAAPNQDRPQPGAQPSPRQAPSGMRQWPM